MRRILALSLLACAAQASFDGEVYRDGAIVFRVGPVPSGWRRVHVSDASLAFRDERNDASALVNARCRHPEDDTPLVALTNHLLMGTTERDVVLQETIPFDAREALHTLLRAKLDGVLMTYDIYVLKKDGCVYDFVYVAAPARAEAGLTAFERFVEGFRTAQPSPLSPQRGLHEKDAGAS
jgi:hypothetical protein